MTALEPGDIRVLGLGNVLMGDDGFGPSVTDALERLWEPSPAVELVDVGTPGLNLAPFLAGGKRIVMVDVVKHGGPPGEVRVFTRQEVLTGPVPQRVSPHDPGLREALLVLEFAGQGPLDFRLVGAPPEHVGTGPGLGPRLREAVPAAVEAVLAILAAWGAPLRLARRGGGAARSRSSRPAAAAHSSQLPMAKPFRGASGSAPLGREPARGGAVRGGEAREAPWCSEARSGAEAGRAEAASRW